MFFIKPYVLRFISLLKAKHVIIDESSLLYPSSHIVNIQKDKTKINIGNNTHIKGELLVYKHGGKISIGDYCYIGEGTRIWSAKNIIIGNNVLIAHNVNIHDNISHPTDPLERHKHFKKIISEGHPSSDIDLKEKIIVIEDNVWIGFNATILRGVTIGNGAIIAACSVVTKDVPANVTVLGNPARVQ